MFKKVMLVCAVCATLFAVPAMAQNATDGEAIKTLIENETRHFYSREFKQWAGCYNQDDKVVWTCAEPEQMLHATGWEKLGAFVGGYLLENPTPVEFKIVRNNYQLNQKGDMAWVNFDALLVTATGESYWKELRVVEKDKAGQWKIACMNAVQTKEQQ